MKVTGIIAEYNPFHTGHLYHLNQARKLTGADFIVVAMSGDFVQRGGPAIFDKYTRAEMALACGADLVLELPSPFAVSITMGMSENSRICWQTSNPSIPGSITSRRIIS